ncbi:M4 family metallopeptidase [Salegentibacter chungangensis]|uniref:M4 family metallopeptidase n=1 Tax=Salegentibacter chungangensis TaxID=1335724 RepID=A0ABW3NNL6_9FLAO
MEKKLLFNSVIIAGLTLFSFQANAQDSEKDVKKRINDEKGKPTLIVFKENSSYNASQHRKLFKEQLELNDRVNFSKIKSENDNAGYQHDKYQMFYEGVKVEFATYTIHSKGENLQSMSGEYYRVQDVDTKPGIPKEVAFRKALNHIGANSYLWEDPESASKIGYEKPEGELVLLPTLKFEVINEKSFKEEVRLAYKFDIYATDPISRGNLYIDAQTGKALLYDATIKHIGKYSHSKSGETSFSGKTSAANAIFATGTAATRYSGSKSIQTSVNGSSYILSDVTRGNGVQTYDMNTGTNYNNAVDFTDNDNNWSAAEHDNAAKDNGALDAHWGAEQTYDYFSGVHNRNSFDNQGAAIESYVHFDVDYDNAYWNGSVMTYGDGSGTYFDILTSLDVAAHEIGHAVCENTANLAYQKESGAMNEAFSDIWAACVEYYAAPSKSTWLIGEDIERRSGHLALRSMSDPKSEGQPDTYGGTNWINPNCTPTDQNDYCGVHTNSGVLNHWFYILAVGKSGTNDIGDSYSVNGISIDKAAQIAYRLESVYLSANSTYANARTYGIQAATDLYGAESPEVIATTNAFYAVGVGSAYGDVSYCSSQGNSIADEYIGRVQLEGIDNSSSASSGYTDFTSVSTDLSKGNQVTITVTPTWTGTTYSEGYAVWIDYNQNGDFGDSGELVWSKSASKTTPVSGSFTVPSSAASGATRMRVSMKYNGIPTQCEAFSYGEVEDYTVNIKDGAPDTEAPSAPANLAASGTTQTSTSLSWDPSTDNVGVAGYNIYKDGGFLTSVTSTSYTVNGLTAATTYDFYVEATDDADNVSAKSNTISVTTQDTSVSYCSSQGSDSSYEWIDLVQLNDLNNPTGDNGGYQDFTSQSASLPYGSNTIYISAGFASSSYTEYWKIWIDYNKDGNFEASELVVSGSSSSSGTLSASFSVPTTASAGTTRMRVSMKYNSAQTACETFSYGEVEDYTVVVGQAAAAIVSTAKPDASPMGNEPNVFDASLYPNPVVSGNLLNVNVPDDRKLDYKIFNSVGYEVASGKLNQAINVARLTSGTYIVRFSDGQKEIVKKFIKL